ncbi:hypothetical protein KC364_g57 [Hortaea werneckii]|nr:hypothetical protein KC364_g57 [Hortaea werneckii]
MSSASTPDTNTPSNTSELCRRSSGYVLRRWRNRQVYGSNSNANLCLLDGKIQPGVPHTTKGKTLHELSLPHHYDVESACPHTTASAHEQEQLTPILNSARDFSSCMGLII